MGIPCKLCGKSAEIRTMRYHTDGVSLVCRPCYDKTHSEKVTKRVKKEVEKGVVRNTPKSESLFEPERRMYDYFYCGRCNYRFKLLTGSHYSKRCPLCSYDDKLIEDSPKDAATLLKESNKNDLGVEFYD